MTRQRVATCSSLTLLLTSARPGLPPRPASTALTCLGSTCPNVHLWDNVFRYSFSVIAGPTVTSSINTRAVNASRGRASCQTKTDCSATSAATRGPHQAKIQNPEYGSTASISRRIQSGVRFADCASKGTRRSPVMYLHFALRALNDISGTSIRFKTRLEEVLHRLLEEAVERIPVDR
ncbi:hypothetical protein VFPBJ_11485 [Purpureocillium lilacinum]|uniref:Secreted protein n=1 Tax=Purpureocillium lilacinum TaxID=33203 RepID=A0A179F899_PURLI|nr:hypothetical protein VFPBJ_11485 [Purpureocillium lilacinum]